MLEQRPSACRGGAPERDIPVTAATGIAQLARLTGVTPRALRYYEAKGVLNATRSRSGTRLFTPHQCEIAVAVVQLRKLGVRLAEIEPIVAIPGPGDARIQAFRELLQQRAADLEQRLNEVRAVMNAEFQPG